MGNNHNADKTDINQQSCRCLKWNKSGSFNSSEDFIISYHKRNKVNDNLLAIDSLDERRLVFVSLPGLYRSWRRVPSILLYPSLLILPLKKEWIQTPSKYISKIQENICETCCCSMDDIVDFIHFLQWKTSQGLALYVLNDLDFDEYSIKIHRFLPNPMVAPFWYRVNAKLISLYDHMEETQSTHYKPLLFEERYWKLFHSKYKTKTKSILAELYFVTMKSSAMQEIIYQSNPKSLHPVIEYGNKYHLYLDPIDVHCDDTHLVSPLSPIIEQKEHETVFAFDVNEISDVDEVDINIDGVTPVQNELNDGMPTPSVYMEMNTVCSYANC